MLGQVSEGTEFKKIDWLRLRSTTPDTERSRSVLFNNTIRYNRNGPRAESRGALNELKSFRKIQQLSYIPDCTNEGWKITVSQMVFDHTFNRKAFSMEVLN
jgi:hypothetical protein